MTPEEIEDLKRFATNLDLNDQEYLAGCIRKAAATAEREAKLRKLCVDAGNACHANANHFREERQYGVAGRYQRLADDLLAASKGGET